MTTLIKLDDVGENRAWNYAKPTLVKEGRFTSKLPTKSDTFARSFYENYPALRKLDMRNIIFKGGCILDLLIGQRVRDLDLFLVDTASEEAALERVKKLLADFAQIEKDRVAEKNEVERERCKKYGSEYQPKHKVEIKAIRRDQVITLTLSAVPVPIQIVLMRYDSVAHCLEDDDLGATAIAFDGQQVWLNERSKFAVENITIMVEPTKLTGTAAKRIEKYFDKGFDIVLPQLDVAKLPRHYQAFPSLCDAAQLPGLMFAYKAIHGNKIYVDQFLQKPEEEKEEEKEQQKYRRGGYAASADDDKNSRAGILAENIFLLCNDQDNFGIFAEGDFLLDVLKIWPGIHSRQLNNFYQRFKNQMVQGSTFNFAIAKQYFVIYTVAEIADKLFTAPKMDKALHQLTKDHIKSADAKLAQWLAKGRADDLVRVERKRVYDCEVFPRLYKEPVEFYGDFFKPTDDIDME